ncbi:hypothetical protein LTS18_001211, partial [Coniosporium uncinatum]
MMHPHSTQAPATESLTKALQTTVGSMISSQLAKQLHPQQRDSQQLAEATFDDQHIEARTPSKSSSKNRSLSDSIPRLSPSPNIKEGRRTSKDDHHIGTTPTTPRRPDFLSRGLSLHMPPRDSGGMPSPAQLANRAPLSPKVDTRNIFGSPATVLPRHSRGLDFSRACTHLHHSTLAEQSSPDSSPTVTQKGINIPQRVGPLNPLTLDSPMMHTNIGWHSAGNNDKTAPSSVSSTMMLMSDDSDSGSEDYDPMDRDDNDEAVISTPQ